MSNQLSFSQLTADLSLQELIFNTPLILTADRSFERTYENGEYRPGDTIFLRKQNRFNGGRGRIIAPEGVLEETVPITIGDEYSQGLNFDSKELTLKVTESAPKYQERYVSPVILKLLSMLETDFMSSAVLDANYFVGSPTARLSDFGVIDDAYALMVDLGMPTMDSSVVISPLDASALKRSNQNAFNPILNEDISFKSQLGHFSIFDVYQSPAVKVHQAGTGAGNPVVSVVPLSGATSISVSGLTPNAVGVYLAGDIITFGIEGTPGAVESVNFTSKQTTGRLAPFTVQANVNADGAGNAIIPIAPAIISDPANPRQNVNQNIPLNSQVNLLGAGLRYRVGLAYSSRGISIVMPPLVRVPAVEVGLAVDERTGVSLRTTLGFDMITGLSLFRIEFIAGFKVHQEYSVKMISAI